MARAAGVIEIVDSKWWTPQIIYCVEGIVDHSAVFGWMYSDSDFCKTSALHFYTMRRIHITGIRKKTMLKNAAINTE
jgi:hypothetical protein